jgi:hypothetical protein
VTSSHKIAPSTVWEAPVKNAYFSKVFFCRFNLFFDD